MIRVSSPRRMVTLAMVLALALTACAKSRSEGNGAWGNAGTGSSASAQPVDDALMAYLSEARALHHMADVQEDRGELAAALKTMDRLVAARRPGATPEVDEVLADAHARRAEIAIKLKDLAAAEESIRKGLELAKAPSYFRGHLLEVFGLLEQARSKALAEAGKHDEAKAAQTRAMDRLDEAVRMQESVIARSLDAAAPAPRPSP
jgi:tetratricopeptide (TPR) repeat protein